MILAGLRWLLFVAYVFLLCTVPFAVLWGSIGLGIGTGLTLIVLFAMRHRAEERIGRRLGIRGLSPAEAPHVHAIVTELSRRLGMPVPSLSVVPSPSFNLAVFGFRQDRYHLVLTEGLLTATSRPELTALIGRQLCHLRTGQVPGESWLCQFFAFFDWLVLSTVRFRGTTSNGQHPSAPSLLRQLVFYPLAVYPAFVLSGHRDGTTLDRYSLRITRNLRAMAEGMRRLDAMAERVPLNTDFSTRHLFLYLPPATDPFLRVFFGEESFRKRIDAVEELTQVVAPV